MTVQMYARESRKWVRDIGKHRSPNGVIEGLLTKVARTIWVLPDRGREYENEYHGVKLA